MQTVLLSWSTCRRTTMHRTLRWQSSHHQQLSSSLKSTSELFRDISQTCNWIQLLFQVCSSHGVLFKEIPQWLSCLQTRIPWPFQPENSFHTSRLCLLQDSPTNLHISMDLSILSREKRQTIPGSTPSTTLMPTTQTVTSTMDTRVSLATISSTLLSSHTKEKDATSMLCTMSIWWDRTNSLALPLRTPPSSIGLQTKRSTDSHTPMRLLSRNVQSAASKSCSVGKCFLSRQVQVEKRLQSSEMLILVRLSKKISTLHQSTHQASPTISSWSRVLLIHRDSSMWIDTHFSTRSMKTYLLLVTPFLEILPERCMELKLRIQSWSTTFSNTFTAKNAMLSMTDTLTCHSSMEPGMLVASSIFMTMSQPLWTIRCLLTESLDSSTCADTWNHRLQPQLATQVWRKIMAHHTTTTPQSTILCRTTSTSIRNKFPSKKFVTPLPKPDLLERLPQLCDSSVGNLKQ